MKSLLIFLSIFSLIFASCSGSSGDSASDTMSSDVRDERFQACYYTDNLAQKSCDSVLRIFFGEQIFTKHIRFDTAQSFVSCQKVDGIEMQAFGDTACCLPNTYDMVYIIRENGQKIYEFRMVSGSDMEFEQISTQSEAQLLGYKKLLDGDFPISFSDARIIAKKNGFTDDMILELVKHEANLQEKSAYHWEAELEYDNNSVVLLWIDVMTGEARKEVLAI